MNQGKIRIVLGLMLIVLLGACAPTPTEIAVKACLDRGYSYTVQGSTVTCTGTDQGKAPASQGGLNPEGFNGPTTGEAQTALGINVQRLRTESSAFVRRTWPNLEPATIGPEYIVTVTEKDKEGNGVVKVYQGKNGLVVNQGAITARYIKGYPTGDAVYEACKLLAKEQAFGASEVPSFPVYPGNFSCPGGNSSIVPSNMTAATNAIAGCPTTAQEAANQIGGNATNWTVKANTNSEGWYFSGPEINFRVPKVGRLDYDGGSLRAGQVAPNPLPRGIVATLWCGG